MKMDVVYYALLPTIVTTQAHVMMHQPYANINFLPTDQNHLTPLTRTKGRANGPTIDLLRGR